MSNPRANFGTAVPPRVAGEAYGSVHFQPLASPCRGYMVEGQSFYAVGETIHELPPAFYQCAVDNYGKPYMRQMDISIDDLIDLQDATAKMLAREFVDFWERAELFRAAGFSQKRGILLYGPPGSGKTSAIMSMAHHMIERLKGVVIVADRPEVMVECLAHFRMNEPERPAIILYEDMDTLVQRFGEAGYLSLLDGEHQVNHVVNVATTNYPECLDRRFVDRPGRFDRVEYVGMPCAEVRRRYLEAKAPDVAPDIIERWVAASEDWSLAHLRELVAAAVLLGEDEDDVIARLQDMREETLSSDREPGQVKVGFAA